LSPEKALVYDYIDTITSSTSLAIAPGYYLYQNKLQITPGGFVLPKAKPFRI